jgi:hypothetical protein
MGSRSFGDDVRSELSAQHSGRKSRTDPVNDYALLSYLCIGYDIGTLNLMRDSLPAV